MFTGARKKKTGNGLAAGCHLFNRKIYGYFLQCISNITAGHPFPDTGLEDARWVNRQVSLT